ncbi:hypothetical protein SRHO_G00149380 [Serrasalmus rhombeus]
MTKLRRKKRQAFALISPGEETERERSERVVMIRSTKTFSKVAACHGEVRIAVVAVGQVTVAPALYSHSDRAVAGVAAPYPSPPWPADGEHLESLCSAPSFLSLI